jgi:hypothetical protein
MSLAFHSPVFGRQHHFGSFRSGGWPGHARRSLALQPMTIERVEELLFMRGGAEDRRKKRTEVLWVFRYAVPCYQRQEELLDPEKFPRADLEAVVTEFSEKAV